MPRQRLPMEKAEVSGAIAKNPQNFRGRTKPKRARPLGQPYATMTPEEAAAWEDMAYNCPWLKAHHRMVLRAACILIAKMDEPKGLSLGGIEALSRLLSKLGATPVDDTKVTHADGDEDEDPSDGYFRPRAN
jgi:hypothetical protein